MTAKTTRKTLTLTEAFLIGTIFGAVSMLIILAAVPV